MLLRRRTFVVLLAGLAACEPSRPAEPPTTRPPAVVPVPTPPPAAALDTTPPTVRYTVATEGDSVIVVRGTASDAASDVALIEWGIESEGGPATRDTVRTLRPARSVDFEIRYPPRRPLRSWQGGFNVRDAAGNWTYVTFRQYLGPVEPRVTLLPTVPGDTLRGVVLPVGLVLTASTRLQRLRLVARTASGEERELLNDNTTVAGQAVDFAPITAWYDVPAGDLPDGAYTLVVTITDQAGRIATAAVPFVMAVPSVPYTLRVLPTLGGDAVAYSANDRGDVAGAAASAPGEPNHAVVWRGGVLRVLRHALPDTIGSSADVVSADGATVGGSVPVGLAYTLAPFCRRAVVWSDLDAPPVRQAPASASACAPYYEGALQMNERGTVLLDGFLWRADERLDRLASGPLGMTPGVLDGRDVAFNAYHVGSYTAIAIQLTTTEVTEIRCQGPIVERVGRGTICIPVQASERGDVLYSGGTGGPIVRTADGTWYDLTRAIGVPASRFFLEARTAMGRGGDVVALDAATARAVLWRAGTVRRVTVDDMGAWELAAVRAPSVGVRIPATVRRRATGELRAAVLDPR